MRLGLAVEGRWEERAARRKRILRATEAAIKAAPARGASSKQSSLLNTLFLFARTLQRQHQNRADRKSALGIEPPGMVKLQGPTGLTRQAPPHQESRDPGRPKGEEPATALKGVEPLGPGKSEDPNDLCAQRRLPENAD